MAEGAPQPDPMSALHWRTASDLAEAIRTRRLSPVELVEALLARIDTVGPKLDAFLHLDAEGALAAAREAERQIAGGSYLGPLHGLPVGIKDCIDIAGMPTTCHSKVFLGNIAKADATVTAYLRRAGAILPGKLAMHECAIDGPDFDLPFPPARNPWNRNHHPGGSSSGSGAAVASGMLPLAVGTDAGGSIRHPASACGIVGLKPTFGLVPVHGAIPLAYSLDHIGPLARSVADAALLLDGLTGRAGEAGASSYGDGLERGAHGLRIGFVRHFHEDDATADEETAAALDRAADVLAREGATIETAILPRLQEFMAVVGTIMLSEAWSAYGPLVRERPDDFGGMTRRRFLSGAFLSASDYVDAQRKRAALIDAVEAVFADHDVLLVASSLCPASRIDDAEELARTYPRQARGPFNVTGHPALAMMAGLSASGMPLSLQLVGRYRDENTLLRAAFAFERATEWHTLRPTDTP